MKERIFGILLLLLSCTCMMAQTETDGQQVFFRVGSASLQAGNLPQSLVDSAQAACARGEKYTVLGVASPEGSYRQNNRLSLRRAKAIVKVLKKRTGLADSMFQVKTQVADISALRDLAAQDENLPEKEAVMALLSAGDATLALLAAVYYYRCKVSSLENELTTARLSEDLSGDRHNEVEERLAASEKALAETEQKFAAAQEELEAQKNTDKEFYKNGEALFSYLQNGGVTNGWTSDQTRAFIDYYRLQNSTLIHTLETEYDKLPLNHILFQILVDMGKTDEEIQHIMNVSQTTIRSYRFRIKNRKLKT